MVHHSWLLFISAVLALSAASSPRPHIILIVADDLGYNDVSFHGSEQIPTPNIDFLGYSGIILNNYYVSPICTPTRSALMTGRHPIHTGMQSGVIVGTQPYGLPLNETIMPQHLNKLGYRSHIVGKWHLGMFKWEYTPLFRGFESHIGYYQGCEDYYTHTYEANLEQWGVDFRKDTELVWNYTGKYSTDVFKEEAVKVINNHDKSQPLFLYLPFQAVHSGNGDGTNLQAPKEYIDKFKYIQNEQRRIYAAMVSALDDAVGQVYDALKTNNMLNNSIIICTTDNGGPANGFDFNAANNFPLRGVKATLWEGGVRGVGLIHSPLLQKQGYVSQQMLHVCDWLPTLVKAAGGDPSTLTNLDGYDSWDMLSQNGPAVRNEILHNIDPQDDSSAIRVGDYKLLMGDLGSSWDGWYPPFQLDGDLQLLHYTNFSTLTSESPSKTELRKNLLQSYRKFWPDSAKTRMKELQSYWATSDVYSKFSHSHADKSENLNMLDFSLNFLSEKQNVDLAAGGAPVTINCGVKPANASTNCHPEVTPCLYHIPSDPCEYNNLAYAMPEVVTAILDRLKNYASTMVPPGNRPYDDSGNPKYHGGAWVPWQK
ncbi:arylsulfatase I-like [Physella acuta]|uniref:arylsulfatase I-like n=1 Tax=Physella acuta TaxID=109671 RepID=UPI0027DE0496|nr:arylsulfatase I-like [Physella acuta]XP_059146183.1 arylsulfatase I-like [Physella acuta]